MDQAARLEANALIDELVQDGDTFSRETAARLIALVPVQAKAAPPIALGVSGEIGGRETRGHAAGVGDVTVEGERKTFSAETSGDEPWRLGGFKLVHRPGRMAIERVVMAVPGKQGRKCALIYDSSGPTRMDVSVAKTIGLWGVGVTLERMVPWKTPTLP